MELAKILIVDDEALIQTLLGALMTQNNHEVVQATDGDSAIELARTEKPDLIVLGMNMPKMTGWEVAPVLRAHPVTKTIPILALTADSSTEGVERAHNAGCDRFLTKPIDTTVFQATVSQMLETGAK